jgi:FkbM family methyltransferase
MVSPAALTRRALRSSPALRALADTSTAQRVIQTQRAARALTPARRVVLRQTRRDAVGCYRLRDCGAQVYVRHRTRDLDIVAEIFTAGSYEPPSEVAHLLEGPLRVADLGGNVGLFGVFALHRWEVTALRSYEPDPGNARLLSATAGPFETWAVVEAAVSNAPGELAFASGLYSESRAARPGEASIAVPVVDLFAEPPADVLKIDIEGGEWPILADPRLRDHEARVIVIEWHAHLCPDTEPREHAGRLLAEAGFTGQYHEVGRFDSNGVMWAWRE